MSRADVHTRFGSPGSPNRPKRARSDRNNLPRARTRARVDRSCRWCSHDDANRGHGGSCTVAGDIPLDIAGLERMCFGDIIKRAQESSTALEAAICDPRRHDHGGRPDATRERVSHAQEIARHRQLLRDARAEHDPYRQKEAYDEAALFRKEMSWQGTGGCISHMMMEHMGES